MTEPAEEQRPEAKRMPGAAPDDDGWDDEDDDRDPAQEVQCECRCGECCRMIIEADVDDAKREPKIAERGSPIYTPAELTGTGKDELEGYMLNDAANGYACTFLNTATNLCSIHPTRPWVCRAFDCDGEQREELVQLGILPPKGQGRSR
jgi:Fe-S-cluster containining protein